MPALGAADIKRGYVLQIASLKAFALSSSISRFKTRSHTGMKLIQTLKCDSFRPCALCKRNNAECVPHRRVQGAVVDGSGSASNIQDRELQRDISIHDIDASPVSTTSSRQSMPNPSTQSQGRAATNHSPSSSSWLEDQGDSTSAIAIARKVSVQQND